MPKKPAFVLYENRRDDAKVNLTPLSPAEIGILSASEATADRVRDLAIHVAYTTLVDVSPGGGHGVFFGKTSQFTVTEYLAVAQDPRQGKGETEHVKKHTVSLLVQVPKGFDFDNPRILAVPSPGSRNIYGGIAVGEWGLENGFAVAYTDKGTGCGIHDLDSGLVFAPEGVPRQAGEAPIGAFVAAKDGGAPFPAHRLAYKQAHSQALCEEAWGHYVLMSIEYAHYILACQAEREGRKLEKPLVIAASYSNGGGAVLRAAELDHQQAEAKSSKRLIDGVVAVEPNVTPRLPENKFVVIEQGKRGQFFSEALPLLAYTTQINIYQGCIPTATTGGVSRARRSALVRQNLLSEGATEADQVQDARDRMRKIGLLPEQEPVQKFYWEWSIPQAICVTYTYAYGRLPVTDLRVGYSFAHVDECGQPAARPAQPVSPLDYAFSYSSGLVPDGLLGIALINERAAGGPVENSQSLSAERNPDANLDGALRLASFFAGTRLNGDDGNIQKTIRESLEKIRATGQPGTLPIIILHGRADAIIAPNHSSRPYYALAKDQGADNIRYYEVTNATHIDALLSQSPVLSQYYLPLHRYAIQGLDLMLKHLTTGALLPPSQVVHTVSRRGQDITTQNLDILLHPIQCAVGPAQAIIANKNLNLFIPD